MKLFIFGVNFGMAGFSVLLLCFLLWAVCRQTDARVGQSKSQRLFLTFVILNLVEIIMDLLSRLDGLDGSAFLACQVGNFVLFFCNPVLILVWFHYVCEQTEIGRRKEKHGLLVQSIFCFVNMAAVAATPKTGLLYSFDPQHIYHRGRFFWITCICMLCMMFYTEGMLLRHRGQIDRAHLRALLFFPVIPTIATVLQMVVYGIAFGLNATAYSILIVFVYVQNRNLDMDYLTGLYNRRRLDLILRQKMAALDSGHTFAGILIDINQFKQINDTLGHQAGDAALVDAANLLRSSLRASTFLARYGGDEFFAVLDIERVEDLHQVMNRVRRAAAAFNQDGERSFRLTFSMGGDIYPVEKPISLSKFQKHLDELMYQEKQVYAIDGIPPVDTPHPNRRVSDKNH